LKNTAFTPELRESVVLLSDLKEGVSANKGTTAGFKVPASIRCCLPSPPAPLPQRGRGKPSACVASLIPTEVSSSTNRRRDADATRSAFIASASRRRFVLLELAIGITSREKRCSSDYSRYLQHHNANISISAIQPVCIAGRHLGGNNCSHPSAKKTLIGSKAG